MKKRSFKRCFQGIHKDSSTSNQSLQKLNNKPFQAITQFLSFFVKKRSIFCKRRFSMIKHVQSFLLRLQTISEKMVKMTFEHFNVLKVRLDSRCTRKSDFMNCVINWLCMLFDREHTCESGPTNRKVVVTVCF